MLLFVVSVEPKLDPCFCVHLAKTGGCRLPPFRSIKDSRVKVIITQKEEGFGRLYVF